jgi:2-succinyl-5-enolpyruvyl-6-hydroxy-3-cyclohexene-1-carboxylate synthase
MPTADQGASLDRSWLDEWRAADRELSHTLDQLAAESRGLPLGVARAVADAVPAGGLLVVGSSQPVRDLDVMMTPYPAGQRRLLLGNRGLAGIDGTLSTAIGAALGRDSSRAIAYLGDVTFVHDLTGLVIGPDEPRPDLTIVVANDDGGAIFATLEQGDDRYARSFERVFGTPHGLSIEAWCDAARTSYAKVGDADMLSAELEQERAGIHVIEVPLDRAGRRQLDAEIRGLA